MANTAYGALRAAKKVLCALWVRYLSIAVDVMHCNAAPVPHDMVEGWGWSEVFKGRVNKNGEQSKLCVVEAGVWFLSANKKKVVPPMCAIRALRIVFAQFVLVALGALF